MNPAGTIDPVSGLNTGGLASYPNNCAFNGEASIALKGSTGNTLTSLAGVTLAYSTLDNLAQPRNGLYAELKPEIAGLGGDSKFFRVAGDVRYYKEFYEDVVGFARFQGGHISPLTDEKLRITDQYFLGPSLVRGFAPKRYRSARRRQRRTPVRTLSAVRPTSAVRSKFSSRSTVFRVISV